jgi:hypothetical protein
MTRVIKEALEPAEERWHAVEGLAAPLERPLNQALVAHWDP